mgnify:CR=1 FL=1
MIEEDMGTDPSTAVELTAPEEWMALFERLTDGQRAQLLNIARTCADINDRDKTEGCSHARRQ